MLGFFVTTLATALSLLVVDLIVPGVELDTVTAAVIAAASIGVVNALVKPVISILSLPASIVSLGAFSLVVNGLCFWLASLFVSGFRVQGIIGFFIGPVVLSFVGTFLTKYLSDRYPQLMGTSTNELAGNSDSVATEN